MLGVLVVLRWCRGSSSTIAVDLHRCRRYSQVIMPLTKTQCRHVLLSPPASSMCLNNSNLIGISLSARALVPPDFLLLAELDENTQRHRQRFNHVQTNLIWFIVIPPAAGRWRCCCWGWPPVSCRRPKAGTAAPEECDSSSYNGFSWIPEGPCSSQQVQFAC